MERLPIQHIADKERAASDNRFLLVFQEHHGQREIPDDSDGLNSDNESLKRVKPRIPDIFMD